MHYEEIFKALNRKKVRYLVTGGVAVNLYGLTRMTLDLDLLISLDQKNKALFYDLLLKMKQESGRERDLIDIGYLKKLKGIQK